MKHIQPHCRLVLTLAFVVVGTFLAAADEPPASVPMELLLSPEPVISQAPQSSSSLPGELEGLLLEEVPMATVCTEMCPGNPAFGIPPYTPNCSNTCTPCYENGKLCGFRCDGWGLNCFPQGCVNPQC